MPLADAYLTLAEFKTRVGITDAAKDDAIGAAIEAASRHIDGYCGRSFGRSDNPEAKYFTVDRSSTAPEYVWIGDVVSVTELALDAGDRTWATVVDAGDYDLLPLSPKPGWPYVAIGRPPLTVLGWGAVVNAPEWTDVWPWPLTRDAIRVTGTFGWPAVPAPVKEACQLIANRQKSLWTAPFGTTGAGELGSGLNMTAALTPLIEEMLEPYKVCSYGS